MSGSLKVGVFPLMSLSVTILPEISGTEMPVFLALSMLGSESIFYVENMPFSGLPSSCEAGCQ